MTLLQKISELNSKGITVTFHPISGINTGTLLEIQTNNQQWQTYNLPTSSMTTSEEWLIVGIIGDMEKKLYKTS